MLSRQSILSGAYHQAFSDVPEDILWPLEKIHASLNETMESRPKDGEVWLFAYGSLLWNPLFEYADRRVATLSGWHRSFCLRTIAGRASVEAPGRMLSLERGGESAGVILRLPDEGLNDELRMIWVREMVTGAYRPTWAKVTLTNGQELTALAFVAETSHPHHENNSEAAVVAPIISAASGALGTNLDYVRKLHQALRQNNLHDAYIDALIAEIDNRAARQPASM
ncbi:gamma-glutamylcyclotransferase [Caballeronia insecticola]|uniref:gamma-glutamylcyclotransferase n=1 Tax=Caballeronia insecticola TaxID=758793 RepID=UPI0005C4BC79|nr:gamma-glutamylcyclotransferase [Caballeronia insecticola]